MSFRWPELLWAVLLVPLVLLVWMRGGGIAASTAVRRLSGLTCSANAW